MVTNPGANREAGRPRLYQDADIFAATSAVLAEHGVQRLTLGAVARQIGCTAQALIRRFGSRQNLLLAHLVWVTDASAANYERLRCEYASPLEAFRTGYVSPRSPERVEGTSPASYAKLLVFGIEAGLDPVLRAELDRRELIYHQNLADSVRAAMAAGELTGCDPDDIAFLLLSAGAGAMLRWTANPIGPPQAQIARVFDAVIGPYQTAATTLGSTGAD
jgi:AcrR family transcriptional regulator